MRSLLMLPLLAIAVFITSTAFKKAPVKYVVDPKATVMDWVGKKVTGKHNGKVNVSAGEIVMDGLKAKSGTFTIDMNTMTVEDLQGGSMEKLLGHLKSDDFFSVAKFPTATFVLSSVTPKSGSTYTVKGKLTIKNITNEIEFPADIQFEGKTMKAKASIKVDRTKYDIRYRSSNFFENLGDKAIYDDFELELNLIARAS
ncbi:MAG: YceI family protein [Chitinophagaceae bacterium]|nr:YceI family protein [Chitinophagaceae bacterium]MCU0403401.1 YceI family protein [Chitinophagaceae bacterium]